MEYCVQKLKDGKLVDAADSPFAVYREKFSNAARKIFRKSELEFNGGVGLVALRECVVQRIPMAIEREWG
jgi:hypothetical protein